ncbi:MAG: D-2-hydroxyacid dehydrogenase [Chloroflexi bacterium]|nr:D-2-hydroxyacid dehydrogenase [Chloroflexota bacterium]
MQIVVLDGYTLNPGDLNWEGLQALGECAIYDRTPPEQVSARMQKAEIVFTNKVVISRSTIEGLPDLRYIGVMATGYNIVDLAAARDRKIVVTNVPDYGTPAVAQMVFALLLELTHHVGHHAQTVREGRWTASPDFCYWDFPLVELKGRTLGIVGFGRIGRSVARIAQAFGMRVITAEPQGISADPPGVAAVDLDTLFQTSDVISLHCPLTPETQGLVNARRLGQMKKSAFLVNTSRGPVVNENDLADALNAGQIAGAALDVLSVEPPPSEHPLFRARNCLVTPHIAWATYEARQRMMQILVRNVKAFLDGQPQNVVS